MRLSDFRSFSLGQPGARLKAWCRSWELDVSCTWHGERCFSCFCWYSDVRANLWPWPQSKTSHVLSSTILSLRRNVLGYATQNGWIQNFEINHFGYLIENVAPTFLVYGYSVLCQRNRTWTQNDMVFEMGINLGVLSLCGINITAKKPCKFNATFFVRVTKNIISKFSVDPPWMDDRKVLFLDRDPEKLHVTFLRFLNSQKLVQSSQHTYCNNVA